MILSSAGFFNLSYSKIKLTIFSPIMPNFIRQELASVYKYFSAKSPKLAKIGNLSFKNLKFPIIIPHYI